MMPEEIVKKLQSLRSNVGKEALSRRTKEKADRVFKQAEDLFEDFEEAIKEETEVAKNKGESAESGVAREELIKFAIAEFEKIQNLLASWKFVEQEPQNNERVLTMREVKLASLRKVVDLYSEMEDREVAEEELDDIEQKLSKLVAEFRFAQSEIPPSVENFETLKGEAELINEEVIQLMSAINLRRLDLPKVESQSRKSGVAARGQSKLERGRCRGLDEDGSLEGLLKKLLSEVCGRKQEPSNYHSAVKLPTLEIPEFNGALKDWMKFKGIFEATIHLNPELNNIKKLIYLQKYVVGEARRVISKFEVSEGNYECAWQMLVRRYDNKRLLIEFYLSSLLNLPSAKDDTSANLKGLLDEVKEIMHSLKNLGEPGWNALVVHLVVSRLPAESVVLWEQSLGVSSEVPEFEKLDDFLEARIQTLTSLESKGERVVPTGQRRSIHSLNQIEGEFNCPLCLGNHLLYKCQGFGKMSVEERNNFVAGKQLCSVCLNLHPGQECKYKWKCRVCKGNHNSLLHWRQEITTANASTSKVVVLATALVNMHSICGEAFKFRALIDPGSMGSFVTEQLMNRLKWSRSENSATVVGVGGKETQSKGCTRFMLQSIFDKNVGIAIDAAILKKITNALPPLPSQQVPSLDNRRWADPFFYLGGEIDILLGADCLPQLLMDESFRINTLLVQKTHLGFIVSGPLYGENSGVIHSFTMSHSEERLDNVLRKFWETEEKVVVHNGLTPEEEACENFYKKTTSVGKDGRYICRLPFKENWSLGKSRHVAIANLLSLERRFRQNEELRVRYTEAMEDYFTRGHAHYCSEINLDEPHYFIPHLAVIKEASSSTKTRIVFNASSASSNRRSLNDNLMVGPTIQDDIVKKIISFRLWKYVMMCDVVKMYRQINIHPQDHCFQRFVWRVNGSIRDCELSTVTFGMASAPFTAVRTLAQLAEDGKEDFPIGARILATKAYVDDLHYGHNTTREVNEGVHELVDLLATAGFEVKKFASNNCAALEGIRTEDRALNNSHSFLGIEWNNEIDEFKLKGVTADPLKNITKRTILKEVAKIYDPLGWVQPIIVVAKMFLQDLWKLKSGWDDELDEKTARKWGVITDSLQRISSVSVPRYMAPGPCRNLEIHGFADASMRAYGAVVYIKYSSMQVPWLVLAKSRVAPIKHVSIPRLELKAALLLSELMVKVKEVICEEESNCNYYAWTDSKVVLAWIQGVTAKWKPFVRNRVSAIEDNIGKSSWHYVSTKNNPADIVSRGCDYETFMNLEYWFRGPLWLNEEAHDSEKYCLDDQELHVIA